MIAIARQLSQFKAMKWFHSSRGLFGVLFLTAVLGCQKQSIEVTPASTAQTSAPTHATAPTTAAGPTYHLDHAQPRLRTMKLWLGTNAVTAEVALSLVEISTGMMFREAMAEEDGMLFVFGQPHQTGFYMKNTKVPLSVAYIDPEGMILEINDLEPLNEEPVMAKSSNVLYVLEMNQGWFDRHKVGVGAAIATERGTLQDVFFPKQ